MTEELSKKLEVDAANIEKALPNTPISTAYMCGVDFFRNNVWHQAAEEPAPGREIILRTSKGMKVHPNTTKSLMAWSYFIRITRAESWAYSEDFLPDPVVSTESKDQ